MRILKNITVLIVGCIILRITKIFCNHCSTPRTFIRPSDIDQQHLPEHTNVTEMRAFVTLYLHLCSFVNMEQLHSIRLCKRGCSVHEPCWAFIYSEIAGCEFCVHEFLWHHSENYFETSNGWEIWLARETFLEFVEGKNRLMFI